MIAETTTMQTDDEFYAVLAYINAKPSRRRAVNAWHFGAVRIKGVLCFSLAEVKAVIK